jgi:hypothetical protein
MPTVSPSQKRLMLAVEHGWHKPGGGGPSRAVAHDFVEADKKVGRVMNKSYQGQTQKFAEGGAVLGKTSQFLKSEDQFRAAYHKDPGAGADKPYGKSGLNAGTGEVKPPAAKGKSLPAVKSRS